MATATKHLIDMQLKGVSLDTFVRKERANGTGWQTIANRIAERTGGYALSRETLRRWYPELVIPENRPKLSA